MRQIEGKVLEELEYHEVLNRVSGFALTQSGKQKALMLRPLYNHQLLIQELHWVNEMKNAVTYDQLPAFSSVEIIDELRMLRIDQSILAEGEIRNVGEITQSIHGLLQFFSKKKDLYPSLSSRLTKVKYHPEIIDAIQKVLDRNGKVKSSASPQLERIRHSLERTQQQIQRAFNKMLENLYNDGWLSDTKESFVGGRRVLSVMSEFKRKVDGHVMGMSNTGKITYIEPASTIALNNELIILENEERLEINRILLGLCNFLRNYYADLAIYQETVVAFDLMRAKGRFAYEINGVLPELSKDGELYLVQGVHPLLYLRNKEKGNKTLGQTLHLSTDHRMLVISGPNAGGKTITLKTIGLLQLMLQSGMLVSCKEYSRFCFFDTVLTDIGDNQSIENELSTYSYRLKQMKHILKTANKKSLVLMDEFGTGSDPELGGALAEVFFQELHKKGAYGALTTHYGNIKVQAENLPGVINGCMLFDRETLSPRYELAIGQPGSSFTFEVAQKIGLDAKLIQDAKKRVRKDRVQFDQSLAEVQKTKAEVEQLKKELFQAKTKSEERAKELEEQIAAYDSKYQRLQEIQQNNQRQIQLGKKFQQFIEQYKPGVKTQKDLLAQFLKSVAIEKTKWVDELSAPKTKQVSGAVKKAKKKKDKTPAERPIKPLVVGAAVRMIDGTVKGLVKEIQNDTVTVQFGDFITKVKSQKLEVV